MPLALAFFTAFTVYGVASPYLPVLIRGLGYSPAVLGFLLGLFEVAGIAGPFLFGRLSDRLGRYRPPLVLAMLLILASLAPLALFRHPAVSAISLVVMAVGLRSMIPLLDATATLSLGPSGDYGRIRTVGSVSFVLMALFLQYVPFLKPDRSVPIIIWIAVTCVATLASFTVLPDCDPAELRSRRSGAVGGDHSRTWDRAFIAGLVMIGLGRIAMSPVTSFFSVYVVEELRWDAVGLLWAISAGSEIPVMFLSAALIRRFGSPRLLALSVVAVAVRLAIYALFPSPAGAVAGQLLHSLCYGLFHPAAIAFVATSVPPERRALGMAMYLSLGQGLPTFIGSALGGFIVEGAGYRALFGSYIIFAVAGLAVYFATRNLLERPCRA